MAEYTANKTLDCKGLKCPMPIVKMSQEMPKSAIGDIIEVISTDPGALSDFPAWAKTTGNQVIETKQEAGLIKIYVKRLK
ncbi:MAG TPA: sulfurtransferase TusA family protein [bacterium]|nr:sulfurtransferase TusA family protein [bacterium]